VFDVCRQRHKGSYVRTLSHNSTTHTLDDVTNNAISGLHRYIPQFNKQTRRPINTNNTTTLTQRPDLSCGSDVAGLYFASFECGLCKFKIGDGPLRLHSPKQRGICSLIQFLTSPCDANWHVTLDNTQIDSKIEVCSNQLV
jgi:hypothetical protein